MWRAFYRRPTSSDDCTVEQFRWGVKYFILPCCVGMVVLSLVLIFGYDKTPIIFTFFTGWGTPNAHQMLLFTCVGLFFPLLALVKWYQARRGSYVGRHRDGGPRNERMWHSDRS